MADEKKKPWQFSLKRLLVAVTMICVSLAVARLIFNTDTVILFPENNVLLSFIVASMGICLAIGVIWGGIKGAIAWGIGAIIIWAVTFTLAG